MVFDSGSQNEMNKKASRVLLVRKMFSRGSSCINLPEFEVLVHTPLHEMTHQLGQLQLKQV